MDDGPSPKRRRISPEPDQPADATSRPSSSSRPDAARHIRPSFASPTRASLARHNPAILERRRSQTPSRSSPTRTQQLLAGRPDAIAASEVGGDQQAISSRRGDDDDAPSSPTRAPARNPGDAANAPRPSPARPNPRPLPRPMPGETDDIERLFPSTTQRFSNLGLRAPVPPEPELPPPSSDPVSSSSPRGIHSSPSRWKERKRRAVKSSPLKPPPERSGPAPPPLEIRRPSSAGGRLDPGTSEERGVLAFDPNAAKRKERNALRMEIEALRRDLEVTRKENERIRRTNATGITVNLADAEAAQNVIQKYLIPADSNTKPTQSQILLKAAMNPLTFFPLGKTPSTTVAGAQSDDDDDIRSHHPITMKAAEELPYLQLFSPFELSSKVSTLPEEESEPCRQRHSITLRSRDNPGIFHARIDMTVNATDLSITDLQVPALEAAAAPELRPLISQICQGECNRSMQRNVGILSWAMVEWQRVAAERALFWLHVTAELATKESIRKTTRKLKLRKAKRKQGEEEEEEEEPDLTDDDFARSDVLACMGRQSYEVELPSGDDRGVWMRIEWKIRFDWAGEAESVLAAMIGVPGKWHAADARGSLGEAPRLFESLTAKDGSKLDAVRTIVALLVGDG